MRIISKNLSIIIFCILCFLVSTNYSRKILPEEKVEFEIEATPWRSGTTFVVASFNANELYNITGTKKVAVIS